MVRILLTPQNVNVVLNYTHGLNFSPNHSLRLLNCNRMDTHLTSALEGTTTVEVSRSEGPELTQSGHRDSQRAAPQTPD